MAPSNPRNHPTCNWEGGGPPTRRHRGRAATTPALRPRAAPSAWLSTWRSTTSRPVVFRRHERAPATFSNEASGADGAGGGSFEESASLSFHRRAGSRKQKIGQVDRGYFVKNHARAPGARSTWFVSSARGAPPPPPERIELLTVSQGRAGPRGRSPSRGRPAAPPLKRLNEGGALIAGWRELEIDGARLFPFRAVAPAPRARRGRPDGARVPLRRGAPSSRSPAIEWVRARCFRTEWQGQVAGTLRSPMDGRVDASAPREPLGPSNAAARTAGPRARRTFYRPAWQWSSTRPGGAPPYSVAGATPRAVGVTGANRRSAWR